MSDTFCPPGDYSYLSNAQRMAFNLWDELFPPGWGQPGETPEGTVRKNAIEGQWIPLDIPDGCDGASDDLVDGIFYALTSPRNPYMLQLDTIAPAGTGDPEADEARWQEALRLGLEIAQSTSGHPMVRE